MEVDNLSQYVSHFWRFLAAKMHQSLVGKVGSAEGFSQKNFCEFLTGKEEGRQKS